MKYLLVLAAVAAVSMAAPQERVQVAHTPNASGYARPDISPAFVQQPQPGQEQPSIAPAYAQQQGNERPSIAPAFAQQPLPGQPGGGPYYKPMKQYGNNFARSNK